MALNNLSVDERLRLISELWDSLADEVEQAPLTEEQKQETDRRLATFRADPNSAIPWDQVEAEALARLS